MKPRSINVVIIDDEADARDLMAEILSGFEEFNLLATAANAFEGLQIIAKHKPDIAFVDINMPVQSGLELAELVSRSQLHTRIVFVTAYDAFMQQAIRTTAFDYLLKPVDPDELAKLLQRYVNLPEHQMEEAISGFIGKKQPQKKVRLNIRTGYLLADPLEIVMIKADGNYSEIFLQNAEKALVSQPIGHFCDILPANVFIRSSRSCLINLNYLRQVDRKNRKVILKAGEQLFQTSITREHLSELDLLTR